MFTGLVEETGQVLALDQNKETGVWKLKIAAKKICQGIAIGDSVAVNGCCLTVTEYEQESLTFDVLEETLQRTSFRILRIGVGVNLERSLTPTSRMGGHFVTGHIDGTGEVFFFGQEGADYRLRICPPQEFMKYVVYKGSIAVDGISLTVAAVDEDTFDIWLIPTTLTATNIHERRAGDPVNLEFDILAKYIEKLSPGQ
ncbi:MAG: riboflavin synthase [Puniceicoccales bacterium]|jgi:riboflavin synthase|nr:riboflavin synthase [Puniceicoccales bacterium]